ncbi:hypothetical protein Moror_5509 [Moniliophthora roreri MCA 2997]|uniref:Uncharacterized protein n=1 Tax=Moniliophthora roreri (strain MCA 2997) TaxID=1381753 RepID=V2X5Z2_MONRO|nr:hypothetical protein Moror_5509 [Moniliophthora roreri MCA 2997]
MTTVSVVFIGEYILKYLHNKPLPKSKDTGKSGEALKEFDDVSHIHEGSNGHLKTDASIFTLGLTTLLLFIRFRVALWVLSLRPASTGIKFPSPPASRWSSLLVNAPADRFDSPVTSPAIVTHPLPLPVLGLRLAPPNKRLLECTDAAELRSKDVAELLKEYKRLVESVLVASVCVNGIFRV